MPPASWRALKTPPPLTPPAPGYTHISPLPPVAGSPVQLLTQDVESLTGGRLAVGDDMVQAALGIARHIDARRRTLGIQGGGHSPPLCQLPRSLAPLAPAAAATRPPCASCRGHSPALYQLPR